jgi:hypothetical protein
LYSYFQRSKYEGGTKKTAGKPLQDWGLEVEKLRGLEVYGFKVSVLLVDKSSFLSSLYSLF